MILKRTMMIVALAGLAGCTQSTPSMMNANPVEVQRQTSMEQIPLNEVDDVTLTLIADDYRRYATGPMQLLLTYDRAGSDFTARDATAALAPINRTMQLKGVTTRTDILAVEGGVPSLMVSYDSMTAQAPIGCRTMPGIDDKKTTRFIGQYRFGCTTESLLAKQIARPADLLGNDNYKNEDGRRAANVVEAGRVYGVGNANEELNDFGQME